MSTRSKEDATLRVATLVALGNKRGAYSPAPGRGGTATKAAVLHAPRTAFALEELSLEAPRAGEVLVRIAAAGVCHSDWHFVSGDLATPLPAVLGHEGAGIVEEVGPNVTGVKPGDHVVLLWRSGCGRCEYCSSGRPALCSVGRTLRANGTLNDGTSRLCGPTGEVKHFLGVSCFAEFAVVPELSTLSIDADVPLEIAALVGCAVMTGVGAVINTAAVRPGKSVLIVGAGGVGLSAVMGARLAGADPILVSDLVPAKRDLARDLGATHVLDGTGDLVTAVRQIVGEGVDYAFDCIGNSALLGQAVKALRRGGTAVAVGLPRADAEVSLNVVELVTQEKSLKGSIYGSTRHYADIPRLIALYRNGRLPIDRLLGRRYRLDEINEAYRALLNGEFARAVITPS